jgi:hypothetical protein
MLFMVTGDQPSGEQLKVTDAPFNAKVADRQTVTGNFWEDVLAYAVKVDTHNQVEVRYSVEWEDTAPKSMYEVASTGETWLRLGVPRRVVWKRLLGATDIECEEWEQLRKEEQAAEPLPPPPLPGETAQGTMPGQPQNGPPAGRTPPQLEPFARQARSMVGRQQQAPSPRRPTRRR